jgi:hypothetical protein
MTTAPLSPHEIATFLLDSGLIDKAAADLLESRIAAHGDSRASQGHNEGVLTAARKAGAIAASLKGANQRAGAEKVWRAIEKLRPQSREAEQAYARGFKDGTEYGTEHRSKRERQPRPDSKMS